MTAIPARLLQLLACALVAMGIFVVAYAAAAAPPAKGKRLASRTGQCTWSRPNVQVSKRDLVLQKCA